jgi:hypothetical protein
MQFGAEKEDKPQISYYIGRNLWFVLFFTSIFFSAYGNPPSLQKMIG